MWVQSVSLCAKPLRKLVRCLGHPNASPSNDFYYLSKGKYKGHPITGHEGPEGEQLYSFTLPSTSALDRSGWSTPRLGRFTPRKDPVPIV